MVRDKQQAAMIQTFADHAVITPQNTLKHAIRTPREREFDDPVARAEAALANLSGEFKSWMRTECDRLAAAHAAVIAKGFTDATRGELFRAAHDIKGDAPTFGFPAAGAAAESLCRIIEHAPDLDALPSDLIQHHIDAVHAIVREHNTIEKAGVADELSRRLRAVADDYLKAANKDRPEHLDALVVPSIAPTI
ncbi:Hpt domain-containing protein [Rhodopseudomonas boonkerdii]|uniref:Hpt domain-containing protein n=1 Tax=Rhodopseudomonas boonkerdii TaxID=475937 RepID=UPI001E317CD4|nr:Hpt domain-containing protein [Rhodopseudomonas boonkerdii]UGV27281.1 Hpt domain-containing protein [Rhodopseudomonas boonkerdii]